MSIEVVKYDKHVRGISKQVTIYFTKGQVIGQLIFSSQMAGCSCMSRDIWGFDSALSLPCIWQALKPGILDITNLYYYS